jgi:hypothetical protein
LLSINMLQSMIMSQKMAVMISVAAVAGALTLSAANSPMIGIVSSGAGVAGVVIDGARVSTDATLFDGSVVSSTGYSRVQLNAGTRIDLSEDSVVRVFANHASLEGGGSRVQSSSGYTIDARTLRIEPSEAGSVATVQLDGNQKVLVAALNAPVNVWNQDGLLVARVMPATAVSFLPQAAASTAFSNSGCVVNKSNAPVLVDATGNQVFELRTTLKTIDLKKFVGKRASVGGMLDAAAKPVAGASQVVNVSTISSATGESCQAVAARIGGTTSAAGIAGGAPAGGTGTVAAASGIGKSAAIIGGVTVAAVGTTVGLIATNAFGGSNLPGCGPGGPVPGYTPATCH